MEKISSEIRTTLGGSFILEKHLTNLRDYSFKGITVKVPEQYNECLRLLYGDWQTPVQYANFNLSKFQILKKKLWFILKNLPPKCIQTKILKKYHRKDLYKFLERCKKNNIIIHDQINY